MTTRSPHQMPNNTQHSSRYGWMGFMFAKNGPTQGEVPHFWGCALFRGGGHARPRLPMVACHLNLNILSSRHGSPEDKDLPCEHMAPCQAVWIPPHVSPLASPPRVEYTEFGFYPSCFLFSELMSWARNRRRKQSSEQKIYSATEGNRNVTSQRTTLLPWIRHSWGNQLRHFPSSLGCLGLVFGAFL